MKPRALVAGPHQKAIGIHEKALDPTFPLGDDGKGKGAGIGCKELDDMCGKE